jgi:CRP-like cAMP-binding protein
MARWFHTIVNSEGLGEKSSHAPGTILIRQGERSSRAYLIISGSVRVFTTDPKHGTQELAVLRSVSLVGEFRLLYNTPASASVEVVDAVEVIAIDQAQFRAVLQKNTGIRYWVIEEANHRLQPLVEKKFGKQWLDRLLAYVATRESLAQFRDEMLAVLFMMINALKHAPPKTCAAAMSNVEDIYNKIVNPSHATQIYMFQAGLAELMAREAKTLDILYIFDSILAGLDAATASRIHRTLRYKGVCYVVGTCDPRALRHLRRAGLTHLDMGMSLHAFVKLPLSAPNLA